MFADEVTSLNRWQRRDLARRIANNPRVRARKNHLAGKRFGRLTVIRRYAGASQGDHAMWECRCDCGNDAFVKTDHLTRRVESTKSCGCLRRDELHVRN